MNTVTPTQYTLTNIQGTQVNLMDYGATLTSLKIATPTGLVELTLGFDTLTDYQNHPFYFGCTVGRVANRIANGQFNFQKTRYQLACNENAFSHLHGGHKGFDKVFWHGEQKNNLVTFSYMSNDGEENYPGNLTVKASYELTDANELKINFNAITDAPTPVNLTNHTYWNLRGAGSGDILNHELEIFSERYLETGLHHLPTGRLLPIRQTPFDFRNRQVIGKYIQEIAGYDHCYLTRDKLAARVREPDSGRVMEVYTTQPGIQFYTGNYLQDYPIANQRRTQRWGGFCLETQGLPDAVNQPRFPSVMLLPNQVYQHATIYKFLF
jgi:aldose 1-epimerase